MHHLYIVPEMHILFHLRENQVLDSNTHVLLNYQQRHNGLFFCIRKRQRIVVLIAC